MGEFEHSGLFEGSKLEISTTNYPGYFLFRFSLSLMNYVALVLQTPSTFLMWVCHVYSTINMPFSCIHCCPPQPHVFGKQISVLQMYRVVYAFFLYALCLNCISDPQQHVEKQEGNGEVSVKAECAYVKSMRKRKEIGLICCEPGVSSPKPQNWQPIITNDCLIRQMIHVPQTMTWSRSEYSVITRFLLGKV